MKLARMVVLLQDQTFKQSTMVLYKKSKQQNSEHPINLMLKNVHKNKATVQSLVCSCKV